MAVFFRANYSDNSGKNIICFEIKISLISLRFDLSLEESGLVLTLGKKRVKIGKSSAKSEVKKQPEIVPPERELVTFYKDSLTLECSLKNKGYFMFKGLNENLIVMIFDLFKNTKEWFSGENGKKSLMYEKIPFISLSLKFKIKAHITGIISYAFKILRARRTNYGSNI